MPIPEAPEVPLFTQEGPQFYAQAFEHNRPWAIQVAGIGPSPGPYQTVLTAPQEIDFAMWVADNSVPFDTVASIVDYDMRGYWLDVIVPGGVWTLGHHFPDKYKTPYSTSFSKWSQYAMPGCPFDWKGDKLYDANTGQLIFWAAYKPPPNIIPIDTPLIEPSALTPSATKKGLLGEDLDLKAFTLYLAGKIKLKTHERILDVVITQTIEGASTIMVTLDDNDRALLRSGQLNKALDVEVDGLWFRLVKVEKDEGDTLTLTLEDRVIAILRTYIAFLIASRSQMTRAEFILSLIREVIEYRIPVVIPELHEIQPIEKDTGPIQNLTGEVGDTTYGVAPWSGAPTDIPTPRESASAHLTVNGSPATPVQIRNANAILDTGMDQGADRRVLVASIMASIAVAEMNNRTDGTRLGVFAMDPAWNIYQNLSVTDRTTVKTAARLWFISADRALGKNPEMILTALCEAVQGTTFVNYGQFRNEAENWVTAYGLPAPETEGDTGSGISAALPPGAAGAPPSNNQATDLAVSGSDYIFYRGDPEDGGKNWKHEDSWTCIQRLASEVQWRAFVRYGVFWYISEEDLLKLQPILIFDESSRGVRNISFDYDTGKKSATITVKIRIGRWLAPPGSVVILRNMGPINGRWLVSEYERSLFGLEATITLKKAMPVLPEPKDQSEVTPPKQPPPNTTSVLTVCNQTAAQIDAYLRSKGSPMAGSGADFVAVGAKYNISPAFLVGLAGQESSYGDPAHTFRPFNPFGYGGMTFVSWADAIDQVAKEIANGPYYFKRRRYSALDVYLDSRWTPARGGPAWQGYCSGGCNTGELLAAIKALGGSAEDIRCQQGGVGVPPGTCLDLAQQVHNQAGSAGSGKNIIVYNASALDDIQRAAQGKPCADGVPIDCNIWRVMLWLIANGLGPISTYAIHSDHGPDGLGGHQRGFAFDLNSTQGHDQGADDPTGAYCLAAATALRGAPAGIRPKGMIITGWQGVYQPTAAALCIPEGSYDGSGPTGFTWAVTEESHANHIHICYTPGIPTP